jgi:hypothetical protein
MSIIRSILNSTKVLVSNSLPTTGSNTFRGTQTYSGSIIPATNNTYDLGDSSHQFRHLYLSSGSLYIDGQKVLGSTGNELQITTDNGQSIKILEAGSDNIILQTADGNIELKTSGGGDVILDPTGGVIGVKGTMTVYSGNKILSSDGNSIQFGNDLGITGSITTTGNVNGVNLSTLSSSLDTRIVTEKNRVDAILSAADADKDSFVEIVSLINSVDTTNDSTFASFYTGSNNRLNNIENVTGSYEAKGRGIVSGSSQVTFSGISSLPTLVSGSSQIDVMSTTNIARLATTGSNTFVGNQIISGAFARFINTSTTSNSNVQLGNDVGTNQAGVALFGSQYVSSGQYRANGAYFYSNLAGGLTLHAEGANPMYLATNNTTAITINSSQNVNFSGKIGIGTASPTATKLSLGTGIGAKLMVYDNGSGVYSGIGQDMAEGNSTDLFAHGSGNLGFITFGKLGTNGTTYTEWARFDTSGNLNIKGGQIQQNGTGIIQMVPIGPTATNISYTATINGQYTIGSASIPSNARWLMADIFITANISDHQNFMMTRFNFGSQKSWVDTRGNNPASEFGNLTQGDIAIVTYNGESDGYTPNYGVWKSSVMVPSVGRTLWINNYGNSNSNGYIYFIVRAYSL